MKNDFGPALPISEEIHKMKYRSVGESFKEAMTRVANALKDDDDHFDTFRNILYNQRFLPAGRVQSAMGAPRTVTPYNCFVSPTIEDSMEGIMAAATNAWCAPAIGDSSTTTANRRSSSIWLSNISPSSMTWSGKPLSGSLIA